MGLKEELTEHFDSSQWAHDVEQLTEMWEHFAKEGFPADADVGMLVGKLFGVTFAAIGDLVDSMVTLAGYIDAPKT